MENMSSKPFFSLSANFCQALIEAQQTKTPSQFKKCIETTLLGNKLIEMHAAITKATIAHRPIPNTNKKVMHPFDYEENAESYHQKTRYKLENAAKKQESLPNFNMARIQNFSKQVSYILAEGPAHDNLSKFYDDLQNNNIHIIFAVGNHHAGNKYFPYFTDKKIWSKITAKDFLDDNIQQKPPLTESTQFEFYKANYLSNAENKTPHHFYTVYIPEWPDHGIPDFSKGDIQMLTYIAEYIKDLTAHCSAGLGRSASILLMFMAYLDNVFATSDEKELVQKYESLIQLIKAIKPTALYDLAQVVTSLRIVEQMQEFKQFNPQNFQEAQSRDFFGSQPSLDPNASNSQPDKASNLNTETNLRSSL